MQAILKFHDYYVEYMFYKRNVDFWKHSKDNKKNKSVKIKPSFMFDVIIDPNTFKNANVIIGVKIGDDIPEEKSPFVVDVVIRGLFSIEADDSDDSEMNKETAMNFYQKNAIAILFPYIRSIVSDLTSKSNHQSVILPTLNIIKVAEDYFNSEEKQEKEENYFYRCIE